MALSTNSNKSLYAVVARFSFVCAYRKLHSRVYTGGVVGLVQHEGRLLPGAKGLTALG